MLSSLFLSVLLTVSDPRHDVSDSAQSIVHTMSDTSVFDVRKLEVNSKDTFTVSLTMGSLANPQNLPYGFSFPIIELYLKDNDASDEGGSNILLPGSNMRLSEGEAWNYAFRITGDGLRVYRWFEGTAQDITDIVSGQLYRDDNNANALVISTTLPLPEDYSLYGVVGSYDPFSATGWRVLNNTDAQGNVERLSEALEVIADDTETQVQALSTQTLPRIDVAKEQAQWLWLVGAGLFVSAASFIAWIASFFIGRKKRKVTRSATDQQVRNASETIRPHSTRRSSKQTQESQKVRQPARQVSPKKIPSDVPARPLLEETDEPIPLGRVGRGRVMRNRNNETTFPSAQQFVVEDDTDSFVDHATTGTVWGRLGRKGRQEKVSTSVPSTADIESRVVDTDSNNATITNVAEKTKSLGEIKSIKSNRGMHTHDLAAELPKDEKSANEEKPSEQLLGNPVAASSAVKSKIEKVRHTTHDKDRRRRKLPKNVLTSRDSN